MHPLTRRQRAVLDFIRDFIRDNQRPPTYQEIADAFGFQSKNGVKCYLLALERKGYIVVDSKTTRGIRLVGQGACPTCGQVVNGGSQ